MKRTLFILTLLIFNFSFPIINAQVGINSDNTDPDASAMLDVKSTNKGLLIPRMGSPELFAISNPANGLLVFNTSTNSFWYFKNGVWTRIKDDVIDSYITDTDDDTKIQVEASTDEDIIRFDIGGDEFLKLSRNATGAVMIEPEDNNSFFGEHAGENNLKDNYSSNNGRYNSFYGSGAGRENTTGDENCFFGFSAGNNNKENNFNSFYGSGAGSSHLIGDRNSFFGYLAGQANHNGTGNCFFGTEAGRFNNIGSHNVFIGYQAGKEGNVSNRLIIENSASTTPLIYGEFDNDLLRFNGRVGVNTSPHASAMMDISSKEKGLLIPRMAAAERYAINNPATGLMVYDLTTNSFWYYYNGAWSEMVTDQMGNHTATENIKLNAHWLSNDGDDEGLKINNTGSTEIKSTSGFPLTIHTAADNSLVRFKNPDDSGWHLRLQGTGGKDLGFSETGAADNRLVLLQGGNVGIGTATPNHPLEMASGAHVTAGGVWTNASDRAKKDNIQDLDYGLAEVMQLQPASYTYKTDSSASIGFIAQEIEQIIPEIVSGPEGDKGVAYGLLTSVLVNAVQEQQTEIEQLKTQNHLLEQRFAHLENLIKTTTAKTGATASNSIK